MTDNNKIYLDFNASTPLSKNALDAMISVEESFFANPHSSEHAQGWGAAAVLDDAARRVADFIGAFDNEIIFVSGATEANNLAIIGSGIAAKRGLKRNKILISAIEHKCVLGAATFLQKHFGYKVEKINVTPNGVIDCDHLADLIDENTLLVSTMAVNNEMGAYQPIRHVSKLCRDVGAILHVDAAQALYSEIDVVEHGIDLLSLSSHKLYGPKGIGALYINQSMTYPPDAIMQGGGQQNGYRSGTVATGLVAGFAAAISELINCRVEEAEYLTELRNQLWEQIQFRIPKARLNGQLIGRHPGNLNILFPGIDAAWLIGTMQPRIAISTGSACSSGVPEPSHVLKSMGLSTEEAENSIRISIGRTTTKEELELAVNEIANAVDVYASEFH